MYRPVFHFAVELDDVSNAATFDVDRELLGALAVGGVHQELELTAITWQQQQDRRNFNDYSNKLMALSSRGGVDTTVPVSGSWAVTVVMLRSTLPSRTLP